ncbi:OmpA family protein [Azotobacter bryophylli]|uniref:OmpA family protein n=1 Tax=Azotobacter bryophylli TaxID=1986537 RepID=A0ABV7AY26_9GAMM
MKRLLLNTATLLLCAGIAACSSVKQPDDAKSVARAEQKASTKAWLDAQEPRLRDALRGSHFEVSRRDDLLVVTVPVDASFNPDRPSMLLPVTLGPVTKVAKLVEKDGKTSVLLLGHGDNSGTAAASRKLSEERARSVAAIFRLSGLGGDRLMYKGMGSDLPRVGNDSKDGRARNRRVEMLLTPRGTLPSVLAQYTTAGKKLVVADQVK